MSENVVNGIVPGTVSKMGKTTNSKEQTGAQKYEQTFSYQPDNKGKGTSVSSNTTDLNTFGKDFANFEKFKGNDKQDAMRITNTAANDVKKLYMQLQHEFPGINIEFEPMPDPKTCGKKREGFFTYQQLLNDWKDRAFTQITNARERSTVELAQGAVKAVNENTNKAAEINAGVTIATGQAVADEVNANTDKAAKDINANVDREGAATRRAVHKEGAATRNTVHKEGAATRRAVHKEGAATRNTVHQEGAATRRAVYIEGDATRETVRREGGTTRRAVHQEGAATRRAVYLEGDETRETVRREGDTTRTTVKKEADRTIDTLDSIGLNRGIKAIRDAAAQAGKSAIDFIKEHPEFMIPGLGIAGAALVTRYPNKFK